MKRILFIGAGRMAQAIIEGLKQKGEFEIIASNNSNEERLQYVRDTYDINVTKNWRDVVRQSDAVLLAMPPDVHSSILKELSSLISGQLVITVAAGMGPSILEAELPEGTAVAWLMPNTAAKLGKSITLLATGKHINEEQVSLVESIANSVGEYEVVSENQVHELTALTGSAPAFIYRVAAALEEIAAESNISHDVARKLVSQMIVGAASMLNTQADPKELANEVATPGGSTAAGLELLESEGLDRLLNKAIDACREKVRDSPPGALKY